MSRENHSTRFQFGRFAAVVLVAGWVLTAFPLGEGAALSRPEWESVGPTPPGSTLTTDQKIALLQEQIVKAPQSLPLRNRLAWAYIRKGRETGDVAYFTRAERLLEKSLAQAGANGEALGLRAWVALFKHEFKEAEAAYQAALKTFAGYHRAAAGLARLRAAEGKAVEAVAFYRQAIESVPYPHYLAPLGDLYSKMGKTGRGPEAIRPRGADRETRPDQPGPL